MHEPPLDAQALPLRTNSESIRSAIN